MRAGVAFEAAPHKPPSGGRDAAEAIAPAGNPRELPPPAPQATRVVGRNHNRWFSPKERRGRDWRDQRSLLIWGLPRETTVRDVLTALVDATRPGKKENTKLRLSLTTTNFRDWNGKLQLRILFKTSTARDNVHRDLQTYHLPGGWHVTKSQTHLARRERRAHRDGPRRREALGGNEAPGAHPVASRSRVDPQTQNSFEALGQLMETPPEPPSPATGDSSSATSSEARELSPSATATPTPAEDPAPSETPRRGPRRRGRRRDVRPLSIATLNTRSLTYGMILELADEKYGPDIIAIQEHKQKKWRRFYNRRYTFILGRPAQTVNSRIQGGEGFLVKHEIAPRCQLLKTYAHQAWLRVHGDPGKKDVILGNVYLPQVTAQDEVKKAINRVSAMTRQHRRSAIVLPLGDLNARFGNARTKQEERHIGRHGGDAERCASGVKWLNWLQVNDYCCLSGRNRRGTWMWTRVEGDHKSAIDHILIPREHRNLIMNQSRVIKRDYGTDHMMVKFTINSNVKATRVKPQTRLRYNLSKLMENKAEFQELLSETFEDWQPMEILNNDASLGIDDIYAQLETKCLHDVELVVGEKKRRRKRRCHRWFNKVRKEIHKRRDVHREYTSQSDPEAKHQAWQRYLEVRKETRKKVRQAQREDFQSCMEDVAKSFEKNRKRFWSQLRKMSSKSKGPAGIIRNKRNGKLCVDAQQKAEAWADYFEDLFGNEFISADEDTNDRVNQTLAERRAENDAGKLGHPFTRDEIRKAYSKLQGGKAKGPDEFEVEMLLAGGDPLQQAILDFVNTSWVREDYTTKWGQGNSFTLFKKGDPLDQDNYRGITLLSVVGKVFTRMLNARIVGELEASGSLTDDQAGFRPRRNCIDNLFVMNQALQDRLSRGEKTYLFFVDLRKAFDTVWHDGLMHRLAEVGIDGKMWRMIDKMYQGSSIRCVVDQARSRPIPCKRGVRQGCPLSPTLFNIMIDVLAKKTQGIGGVPFDRENRQASEDLQHLLFADDAVFFTETAEELQELIDCINKECQLWGLTINAGKSATMIVAPPSRNPDDDPAPGESFVLKKSGRHDEDTLLPMADVYEYLGVLVNNQGTWTHQFHKLREDITEKQSSFAFLFQNRVVPVEPKLTVWKAVVRSKLEYGAEVWNLTAAQMRIMQSLQHQALKSMVPCNRKTSDWAIRTQMGCIRQNARMKMLKARWYVKMKALPPSDRRHKALDLHRRGHKRKYRNLPNQLRRELEIPDECWEHWVEDRKLELRQQEQEEQMPYDKAALRRLTEDSPREEVLKIWRDWKGTTIPCPSTPEALRLMQSEYKHQPIKWKGELKRATWAYEESAASAALDNRDAPKLELLRHIREIRGKAIQLRIKGKPTLAKRICFRFASGTHALASDQHHRSGGWNCRFCDAGVEENVYHHILECEAFEEERKSMLEGVAADSFEEFIPEMANYQDPMKQVATFLSIAMADRLEDMTENTIPCPEFPNTPSAEDARQARHDHEQKIQEALTENAMVIHVDAAAGPENAIGAGISGTQHNGTTFNRSRPVSPNAHLFWAEVEAIGLAADAARDQRRDDNQPLVIVSKSQSAIRTVAALVPKYVHARQVRDKLLALGNPIRLFWSPTGANSPAQQRAASEAVTAANLAHTNPRQAEGMLPEDAYARYADADEPRNPRGLDPEREALREFDEDARYGPSQDVPRLERWIEAKTNGLHPSETVGEILSIRERQEIMRKLITSITLKRNQFRAREEAARPRPPRDQPRRPRAEAAQEEANDRPIRPHRAQQRHQENKSNNEELTHEGSANQEQQIRPSRARRREQPPKSPSHNYNNSILRYLIRRNNTGSGPSTTAPHNVGGGHGRQATPR